MKSSYTTDNGDKIAYVRSQCVPESLESMFLLTRFLLPQVENNYEQLK